MISIQIKKDLLSGAEKMTVEVDFQLRRGEFLGLSGPSGSGKTTLLRLIAGLDQPDRGFIQYDKVVWLDTRQGIALSPQNREVGFVFQDYALFPNMSVRENMEDALDKTDASGIIEELTDILEIRNMLDQYPATLSGGQQQRVALARSLVRRPHLLLLDEPLSALDAGMRNRLQDYILRVHNAFSLTTIMVSHDPDELSKMAHRIIQLRRGKI
ncbi:MAG: ATP-binding cassette domain-containing protein, partial [Saprospiraceae bacterium]|nr:ATP-binding cassette domain-containing protein [Saprospiraceae bacterium]